jgi:CRISPR-associated protein Csx3
VVDWQFFRDMRRRSMVNVLPAVLVGGPQHAGKSVLFYRLTQALRALGIDHYALRACPDGEGNWFHEIPADLVDTLRINRSKVWPSGFVPAMTQALEQRSLPFLVDMGGRPSAADTPLLRNCTRSILLLREDKPADTQTWQQLIEAHNLLPVAQIFSRQTGDSLITAHTPILEGVMTGLERETARTNAGAGPLFDELVACLATLFTSYDFEAWRTLNLQRAPTELALDVQQELRAFTTTSTSWETNMLQPLLERLPAQTPLSVYGIGPGWLYAALAAYTDPQPFYLYDPKLPFGWVEPARVSLSTEATHMDTMHVETSYTPEATILKISFPQERIDYLQPDALVFPSIPTERGLIIDGKVPNWLLTALTRLYKAAGIAWIAPFYPPLGKAVVAYARGESPRLGELVAKLGD